MVYWIMKRDGNDLMPGQPRGHPIYAWQAKYAGPFDDLIEAQAEARQLNEQQDSIIRATQDPHEMEINFYVVTDKDIEEMREMGVKVIENMPAGAAFLEHTLQNEAPPS